MNDADFREPFRYCEPRRTGNQSQFCEPLRFGYAYRFGETRRFGEPCRIGAGAGRSRDAGR